MTFLVSGDMQYTNNYNDTNTDANNYNDNENDTSNDNDIESCNSRDCKNAMESQLDDCWSLQIAYNYACNVIKFINYNSFNWYKKTNSFHLQRAQK